MKLPLSSSSSTTRTTTTTTTTTIAAAATTTTTAALLLFVLSLSSLPTPTTAWGSSGNNEDVSLYGNSLDRDWLYDSKSISLQLEGCMWGYVEDNEDSGCMEDSSEDGTTYWYQMANCRRAQAVFSLYASSSSSTSCNSGNFKETFVTKNGLNEFIYYMQQYDSSNPFGNNYGNDDDNANDDGGYNGGADMDNLPMCEQGNNGYIGLGCASDGTFSLQYFDDAYCLQPSGKTYDSLNTLNKQLKYYKNCATIYSSSNGDESNLAQLLTYYSDSCSSLDSGLCTDNENMKSRRSSTAGSYTRNRAAFASSRSWMTKLKYVAGGLLLLASFVMFTGILFTNRRRRRALMQRKYRQRHHRHRKDERSRRSKSSSRSKSNKRRSDGSKSRRSSRSRSARKVKQSSSGGGGGDGEGVLT